MSKTGTEHSLQYVLGCGVTASLHPLTYAKVLIQLGHEPLTPTIGKSIFGKPVVTYPNIFKYLGHIRKSEGFFGMYRGLGAKLIGSFAGNTISMKIKTYYKEQQENQPNPLDELDGEEPSALLSWKVMAIETSQESAAKIAGIVVSQPFQVIMIRQMAQFVGRETNYDGFFASIREIYNNDGIFGFFSGLVPRVLCELASIWLANVLTQIVYEYVIPKNNRSPDLKGYTSGVCSLLVTQVTYPLSLVSNIMAANGSGLQAGEPTYDNWRMCYAELSAANQLKRGSSMFWRRVPNNALVSRFITKTAY
jgi:carrier protein